MNQDGSNPLSFKLGNPAAYSYCTKKIAITLGFICKNLSQPLSQPQAFDEMLFRKKLQRLFINICPSTFGRGIGHSLAAPVEGALAKVAQKLGVRGKVIVLISQEHGHDHRLRLHGCIRYVIVIPAHLCCDY
jgi:hypothetical protein